MPTRRVICRTHNHYVDSRTGLTFQETQVPSPDPVNEGRKVWLGVIDDVDPAVVREFYLRHPSFIVEGYSDEELGVAPPTPVDPSQLEQGAPPAGTPEGDGGQARGEGAAAEAGQPGGDGGERASEQVPTGAAGGSAEGGSDAAKGGEGGGEPATNQAARDGGSTEPPKRPEDPEALPPGYSLGDGRGGYYPLAAPDGTEIPGPSNGKWQGKDGAANAAWAHLAAQPAGA